MSNFHTPHSRPLRQYVDFVWQSESYVQPHSRERVLPTGTVDLVIDLATPHRSVVSGIQSSSIWLDTSKPLTLLGVRLRAGGAGGVLGIPAIELQNQAIPLGDIWPSAVEEFIDMLNNAPPQMRCRLMEQHLLRRVRDSRSADAAVRWAADRWRSSLRPLSVQLMAKQLGCGVKRFSQRFCEQVGVAPKLYARLMRFQHALAMTQTQDLDWTDLALRAGYYDQAHFNHDFLEFAGTTPTGYVTRRTGHTNHVACD